MAIANSVPSNPPFQLGVEQPLAKKRRARRKPHVVPTFPEGLTVNQKLLYIDEPVTAPVLATILGVSPITIFKKAKANQIPHIRVGSAVRFDTRAVARWLEGRVQ